MNREIPLITIKMTKKFISGTLIGIEHDSTMTFVHAQAALEWRDCINQKSKAGKLPYKLIKFEILS